MEKDYYSILNVQNNATSAEIKKAYRQLAKQYHPDTEKRNTAGAAADKFKEVAEAYQVLGDRQKRTLYDQRRTDPWQRQEQTVYTGYGKRQTQGFKRKGCYGGRCGKRGMRYWSGRRPTPGQEESIVSIIREYLKLERLW